MWFSLTTYHYLEPWLNTSYPTKKVFGRFRQLLLGTWGSKKLLMGFLFHGSLVLSFLVKELRLHLNSKSRFYRILRFQKILFKKFFPASWGPWKISQKWCFGRLLSYHQKGPFSPSLPPLDKACFSCQNHMTFSSFHCLKSVVFWFLTSKSWMLRRMTMRFSHVKKKKLNSKRMIFLFAFFF